MADLDYETVVGRLAMVVGDSDDVGDDPDTVWCTSGTVRFTPLTPVAKVPGGLPVPWTGGQHVIDATIDANGYLTYGGKQFVKLVDLTSPKVTPQIPEGRATHQVEFINVRAGATTVTFPRATLRVAADMVDPETGVIDLTLATPVPVAAGVPITIGLRGRGVETLGIDGGELTAEFTDGTSEVVGELPVGPGGSDPGVAEYFDDEDSATTAAALARVQADLEKTSGSVLAPTITAKNLEGVTDPGPIRDAVDDRALEVAGDAIDDDATALAIGTEARIAARIAEQAFLDAADARLSQIAYRTRDLPVSSSVTLSDGWVAQAIIRGGRLLIGSKRSTMQLGTSADGITWTSVRTFTKIIRDLDILPDGSALVAVANDSSSCDIWRGVGFVASPGTATWTQIYTGNVNEVAVWPAYDYSGMTHDSAGNAWAVLYGTKTNVDPGSNPGAVRVIRLTGAGYATTSTIFNLRTWLIGRGFNPDTWGFHLHGCAFDPWTGRLLVSYGDTNGANGDNGLLSMNPDGSDVQIIYSKATVTGGDFQAVGIWPMEKGVVLQNDGPPSAVYRVPRTASNGYGPVEVAHLITAAGGSPVIGRQPYRAPYPGAPLLLPSTQFGAGTVYSRIDATVDGERFHTLLLDTTADTGAFQGMVTAIGPTATGKLIATRSMTAGLQTLTIPIDALT